MLFREYAASLGVDLEFQGSARSSRRCRRVRDKEAKGSILLEHEQEDVCSGSSRTASLDENCPYRDEAALYPPRSPWSRPRPPAGRDHRKRARELGYAPPACCSTRCRRWTRRRLCTGALASSRRRPTASIRSRARASSSSTFADMCGVRPRLSDPGVCARHIAGFSCGACSWHSSQGRGRHSPRGRRQGRGACRRRRLCRRRLSRGAPARGRGGNREDDGLAGRGPTGPRAGSAVLGAVRPRARLGSRSRDWPICSNRRWRGARRAALGPAAGARGGAPVVGGGKAGAGSADDLDGVPGRPSAAGRSMARARGGRRRAVAGSSTALVLEFVARRLAEEPVGLLVAERVTGGVTKVAPLGLERAELELRRRAGWGR